MFVPLGDNISKRTFPVLGAVLIAINVFVYMYTTQLWFDSVKPASLSITSEGGFGLQMAAPAYEKFMHRWGLVPRELARGNVFSIFSSMFMHADIFDMLGNMMLLYALMGSLESLLGWERFLCCYLGWGVAAALAQVTAHWGSTIPTIGASGAIAGVIGAYCVAFGPFSKIRTMVWLLTPMKFNVPATLFVVFWVLDQLLDLSAVVGSGVAGVAWFAQVGGFVAGAATMYVLKPTLAGRMVFDEHGQLYIRAHGEGEPAKPEKSEIQAAQPEAVAMQCPYCGAELVNAVRIRDRLLRCANENRGRLTFPTSALPAASEAEPASVSIKSS